MSTGHLASLHAASGLAGPMAASRTDQQNASLDAFLASVERKAFRIAELSTRNPDEALDIVQDAMEKLVTRYGDMADESQRRMLFFGILNNRIVDWHRRQSVRRRFSGWLDSAATDDGPADPLAEAPDLKGLGPQDRAAEGEKATRIDAALAQLPLRQRQAFLLHCWEGLSVAETATVMKCSAGSVKTHLSRARSALQEQLGEFRALENDSGRVA